MKSISPKACLKIDCRSMHHIMKFSCLGSLGMNGIRKATTFNAKSNEVQRRIGSVQTIIHTSPRDINGVGILT